MSGRGAYRNVLEVRDARALIGASAASQVGDWLYNAALLGYVYSATGSAAWVGAATIGRLLPYVLLGPVGGTVADRYDRRTVLLVGDLARFVLMLALAAVVAADGAVVLVIAFTALASAAGAAEKPAADGPAPPSRRGGPARARQRAPAHGAGSRCGRRSGDRCRAAGRGAGLGGLPRERGDVRPVGLTHLHDAPPAHTRWCERR